MLTPVVSPIRQTLLPNPCLRQKPFNRSASVGHSDPVLSSQNSQMVDGEPVAKRRPGKLYNRSSQSNLPLVTSIATLGPIRNGTAFTPISIPDASSNFSSIPFERIQESTLLNTSQEVKNEPYITPTHFFHVDSRLLESDSTYTLGSNRHATGSADRHAFANRVRSIDSHYQCAYDRRHRPRKSSTHSGARHKYQTGVFCREFKRSNRHDQLEHDEQ